MLRNLLATAVLTAIATTTSAQSPTSLSDCNDALTSNAKFFDVYQTKLNEAFRSVAEDPSFAEEVFQDVVNWPGHDVNLGGCAAVTELSDADIDEVHRVNDFMKTGGVCGLTVVTMAENNLAWHQNREPWMAEAKDSNGNLLITDADMADVAMGIYRASSAVLNNPSCTVEPKMTEWAFGTLKWAEKILNDPRFSQ